MEKNHKAYSVLRMAGHVTLVNADQTHAHEPFGMHPIWAIRGMDPADAVLNVTHCVLSIIHRCRAKKKKKHLQCIVHHQYLVCNYVAEHLFCQ